MTLWSVFNICGHVYSKKKFNFILVLIKLVSDESDKIQRRCDQKCVLPAGENGRHRASPGVTGRHRASPGDHVKKRPEFFFAWTRKVLIDLRCSAQNHSKSDLRLEPRALHRRSRY